MREKLRQFMIGRYGTDGLNQFLSIASLVLHSMYRKWVKNFRLPFLLLMIRNRFISRDGAGIETNSGILR